MRLDDKPVHLLPFRSFKVKVLRRTQRFPYQRFLGERCDLFRCAFPLEVILSIRQVGFELGEIANNEHVLRSPERGEGEYKPSVGQDLGATDGAVVRERVGGNILGWKRWVSCGLVRGIRDRKDEELVARMIASSQVKKCRVLGELRRINAYLRKKTEISGLIGK